MERRKDKHFQKVIRSNLSTLCEHTDCNSTFLDIFIQKSFMSPYEKDVILGKIPKYEKSSEFYSKIIQKGPSAYKTLVNALRMTDQNYPADILLAEGGSLKDDLLPSQFQAQEGKELNYYSNNTVCDAMDMSQSVDDTSNRLNQLSVSVTSPLLLNPLPMRQPIALQPNITQPGTGVVPLSAPSFGAFATPTAPPDFEGIAPEIAEYLAPYKLQSSPKGYALIINIISFDYKESWQRQGANHDSESLSKLFQDLGYLVYSIENLSAHEFMLVIEEFKDHFKTEPVDSSVVCVMSHGDEGDNIYTRDGAIINIKRQILEQFNNINCPQLKGKPKLFFFQFCRGDVTDYGTPTCDRTETDSRAISFSSFKIPEPTTTIPTWTDMLVCYSTLEGHYAYRETDAGSWFIQILCYTFRSYGHQLDICELLNLVAQQMKSRVGEEGQKQICPYTNIGFTKKLYLNRDK